MRKIGVVIVGLSLMALTAASQAQNQAQKSVPEKGTSKVVRFPKPDGVLTVAGLLRVRSAAGRMIIVTSDGTTLSLPPQAKVMFRGNRGSVVRLVSKPGSDSTVTGASEVHWYVTKQGE